MEEKFTDEDGWDCVPELNEAVKIMEEMDDIIYEIKHCVRGHSLDNMVVSMIETMREAIEELETIDTDIEWITKEEDEE